MASTPARRPAEWARVKDKATGHKFTVAASTVDEERYQVLKSDAVDDYGNPLPAEHATSAPTPTTSTADSGEKKEGRGAAKTEGEGK